MDFEFTMIDKVDLLLVSGALSSSLDKYRPIKLRGRPLVLTRENKLKMFNHRYKRKVEMEVRRIHKKRPEIVKAFMSQFKESLITKESNLSTTYINRYLNTDDRAPIVVLWNGTTDRIILDRLRLPNIQTILNITTYSENNDSNFCLKLENLGTGKEVIFNTEIGYQKKEGRMLNLKETHDLICKEKHTITHCHDPVTDVILTKCIFKYIVKTMKPSNLYHICGLSKTEPPRKLN